MLWGKYEELRPDQVDAILAETGVAYIAWGSLEWHGRQNAIGLDALKAYELCLRCAQETGGVVLPPVYAGFQTMKPHAGFQHTFEIRRQTAMDLLEQYLDQLCDEGFKLVCLMMGHYGGLHVDAIRKTVEWWEQNHGGPPGRGGMKVWAFTDFEPVQADGIGGDHAGKNETSLLLHLRPGLTDLSQLPTDRALDPKIDGIGGADPREATAQYGEHIAQLVVQRVAEGVAARLAG
jgi:creatinine amidohydrolase